MTDIHETNGVNMLSDDISTQARKAITQPPETWFGNENLWYTHGMSGFSKTRDSAIVDICNWDCVIEDITDEFGEEDVDGDWFVVHSSHWAVGWVKQLMVRILKDPDYGTHFGERFAEENITDIFKWCMGRLYEQMYVVPVWDEMKYEEMLDEQRIHNTEDNWPRWISDNANAGEVVSFLQEADVYPENDDSGEAVYFNEWDIQAACFLLGFIDPDDIEDALEDIQEIIREHRGSLWDELENSFYALFTITL